MLLCCALRAGRPQRAVHAGRERPPTLRHHFHRARVRVRRVRGAALVELGEVQHEQRHGRRGRAQVRRLLGRRALQPLASARRRLIYLELLLL